MKRIVLIGNIVGYVIACLIYGQLLPVLSGPALVGVFAGGAIAFIPVLISGLGGLGSTRPASKEERRRIKEKEIQEGQKKQKNIEAELKKRYSSWSTDALRAELEESQNGGDSHERITIIQELRRRKQESRKQPTSE